MNLTPNMQKGLSIQNTDIVVFLTYIMCAKSIVFSFQIKHIVFI
jgi:hypothetical protein